MVKNYIKIAWRQFVKNRAYSAINVLGLAVGIAVSSLIAFFVLDELSFDQYHQYKDRIFRVAHIRTTNGVAANQASSPIYLGKVIKEEIPDVEKVVRFMQDQGGVMKVGDEKFEERQFCFTDPAVFETFDFEFIAGDPKLAMESPEGLVITESIAIKYFGDENPMDKDLIYSNWSQDFSFKITGVVKDMPHNSHFQFDIFAPFETKNNLWHQMHGTDWYMSGGYTYVLLKNSKNTEQVETGLSNIIENRLPEDLKKSTEFYLQPLTDIYLTSNLQNELGTNGNLNYIYVFTSIGIMVLLIACVNFMNLATARSSKRALEIGVRKTFGAKKRMLMEQFFGEAILIVIFSLSLGIVLIYILLPIFNQMTGKQMSYVPWNDLEITLIILCIGMVTTFLSGSYPALYLSSIKPTRVLKSNVHSIAGGHPVLRKGLVIFQFTISIILLSSLFIINDQVDFLQTKDLGFNKKEIVFVNGFNFRKYTALRDEVRAIAGVEQVSGGWTIPGSQNSQPFDNLFRTDKTDETQRLEAKLGIIDYGFTEVMGIKLVSGRSFSKDFGEDRQQSLMVNEAFVKRAGWKDPIGKEIEIFNMVGRSSGMRKVVGVMTDFNFESLHFAVQPLVYSLNPNMAGNIILKVQSGSTREILKKIEEIKPKYESDRPMQTFFLDKNMNSIYENERTLGDMITYFTILALFISCLGLFGVASFSSEQKKREIGIRKVLGADALVLATGHTLSYTSLVIFSLLIGIPTSYYFMNLWLSNFAFRIEIPLMMVFPVGMITLLTTWATVSFHSVRSSLTNPVDVLRNE